MKYYRGIWNETRGDEFDGWGTSTWFFELDNENYPNRQIEIYKNGMRLKYDRFNIEDQYGGLGDQKLDLDEMNGSEISKELFEAEWGTD